MLLPLDLQENFYALKWGGDDRLRDGGEETCRGDLADGELVVFDWAEGSYEVLAYIVALNLLEEGGSWKIGQLTQKLTATVGN